jgi:hypothetical protein
MNLNKEPPDVIINRLSTKAITCVQTRHNMIINCRETNLKRTLTVQQLTSMNARDSVLAKNTCESFFAVNVSLPS